LYNELVAILKKDHSVTFFNNPAITIVDTAIKYIVVIGNIWYKYFYYKFEFGY
jgi:hypothetical protein